MILRIFSRTTISVIASIAGLLALTACGSNLGTDSAFPESGPSGQVFPDGRPKERETIFGEGGLFGGSKSLKDGEGGGGIGVNSYLWRASLDTLSFMPLSSADPFGGVIITDWYSPAESPGERFKVTVYILDRRLRADGIRSLPSNRIWMPPIIGCQFSSRPKPLPIWKMPF